ncbi:MAG: prolyl oligopeptidase family serine peptidase, partial [Planctomycetota bacterium]
MRCPGRVAAALLAAVLIGCDDELDDLQPDLLVTELSAPAQMQAGTSDSVRVTVWNRGVRKAREPFRVIVEAARPSDPGFNSPVLLDELELSQLAARVEVTYYCGLTMPNGDEGVWSLRATADPDNTVPAADELNNTALTTVWNEDELPPGFGSILCAPDPARAGVTIAIVFASSESLASTPDVTVDSLPATLTSNTGLDYIYEYVVVGTETEGVVPVSVQGTDTATPGNDGIGATTVTLDFTSPVLGPATASPDPAKAGDTLAITFDSTELLSTTSDVTIDGRTATFVSQSALTYTYSYDVQGPGPGAETEGTVAIEVSAADPAGNPASSAGSAVFDFTLPTLTMLKVTPDLAMAGDTLSIAFSSDELLSASTDVTVAGQPAAFVSESGPPYVYTYSYLALGSETEGSVTVDVTASDLAGNPGSASVEMTFDFTAPEILNLSVTPDTATPGDTLTITFSSDEPLAATPDVAVDSIPATFVTGSALAYTYEYLVQGTETEGGVVVSVSVSDPVGNEGTGTGMAVLDFRKPSLSVAPSPAMLYALEGATGPVTSDLTLSLSLGSNIQWEATLADSWLSLDVTSGVLSDEDIQPLILSADPTGLTEDLYVSTVSFFPSSAPSDCEPFDLTVSFAVRPAATGSGTLVYYTSVIDLSEQPYGLRLPSGFPVPGSYPVAVHMHGYGGGASASFTGAAPIVADGNGWILVNVEGRGNHHYDGAAETDLFEVLADVDAAYGVDWTQVFLEGHSMGGTGALRFIARHPDVFAGAAAGAGWNDYRQWYRNHYAPPPPSEYAVHPSRWSNLEDASALRQVQNILTGRLYFSVGGEDPTNWAENGLKLEQRLIRLGTAYAMDYEPTGGHSSNPPHNQAVRYAFLGGLAPYSPLPALDPDPASVRIRANRLRTAKHAWLQIERFIWDGFAEVTADRVGSTFDITARNVQRFTISSVPTPGTYSVMV